MYHEMSKALSWRIEQFHIGVMQLILLTISIDILDRISDWPLVGVMPLILSKQTIR